MLKDLAILIATLCACIVSLFLVVGFGKILGIPPEQLHGPTFVFTATNVVLVLLALIVPILIILTVHARILKAKWNSFDQSSKPVKYLWYGLLAGLILQACNYALKYAASNGVTIEHIVPGDVEVKKWTLYYLWYLFLLVLNSISEELVFRVFPLVTIARHQSQRWIVILIVSISFSVVHFLTSEADVASFVFRTLYGILFCQIFLETRSFWLIVGIHTGTNLLATFLSGNWQSGGFYNLTWNTEPALMQYSFSIILSVAILLLWRFGARLKSSREDH